jgi:hypothetical protein
MITLAYDTLVNLIEANDENGIQEFLDSKTVQVDDRSEVSLSYRLKW